MARESKMSRFKNSFKSPKKRHTHGLLDHPTKVKTSVKLGKNGGKTDNNRLIRLLSKSYPALFSGY